MNRLKVLSLALSCMFATQALKAAEFIILNNRSRDTKFAHIAGDAIKAVTVTPGRETPETSKTYALETKSELAGMIPEREEPFATPVGELIIFRGVDLSKLDDVWYEGFSFPTHKNPEYPKLAYAKIHLKTKGLDNDKTYLTFFTDDMHPVFMELDKATRRSLVSSIVNINLERNNLIFGLLSNFFKSFPPNKQNYLHNAYIVLTKILATAVQENSLPPGFPDNIDAPVITANDTRGQIALLQRTIGDFAKRTGLMRLKEISCYAHLAETLDTLLKNIEAFKRAEESRE